MISLRVLHLLGSLHASAAASQAVNLGRWLSHAGHQVLLVTEGGEREADAIEAGVQMAHYRAGGALWGLRGRRKLLKAAEAFHADIIHVLHADELELGLAIAERCHLPLIASVHGVVAEEALPMLQHPQVSLVLVPSESLRAHLVGRRGLARDHVGLLPYGLDLNRYVPPPPREGLRTVGAFAVFDDPDSGLGTLLRGLAQPAVPQVELLCYGRGDRSLAETEVANLGLGRRIRFAASQPRCGPLLAGVDALIYPEPRDSHPIVVLKAMAMARPIIATAVGSITELIQDQVTGLLVPHDDPTALAVALRRLADEPGLARSLGEAARSYVAQQHSLGLIGELAQAAYVSTLRGGDHNASETVSAYRRLTTTRMRIPAPAAEAG